MKITIDTTQKTIQIDEPILIFELLEQLDELGIKYYEYSIIPKIITWNSPQWVSTEFK